MQAGRNDGTIHFGYKKTRNFNINKKGTKKRNFGIKNDEKRKTQTKMSATVTSQEQFQVIENCTCFWKLELVLC